MSTNTTEYDLVVWGGTGFVGTLLAEYLTERYTPAELSLAIGGRDERRLESLASTLTDQRDDWGTIPVVVGDATDPDSLHDIAEQTSVVCTTVGPYTTLGTGMVEACVSTGTDYCDLTGEVTWVREMIDRFHEEAVDAEARIVHSCGFDSIPADIGTLLVQSYASEHFDAACDLVRIYPEAGEGGVSGGTMASMAAMFEAVSTDPLARETLRNPYSLAPAGQRDGVDPGEQRLPRRDLLRSQWTAPSPMAAVNERMIRRSNALRGYPWGREFRCTEVIPTGSGPAGAMRASAITGGIGIATAGMSIPPIRSWLERSVFPDPGEGPSREEIETGHFTVRVLGRGTNRSGSFVVESTISADRDPGYGATARMLGAAAICLVNEETDSPLPGGILTPASGIGEPLVERLREAGLSISVGQWHEDD